MKKTMLTPCYARHRRQRGFYMIGVLAVVAIIMILVYLQIAPEYEGGKPAPMERIDKGKETACALNRQTLRTHVVTWSINHVGEEASIEALKGSNVVVPTCPAGGELSISADGSVYCSLHDPDPDALPPPTPTPTPTPEGPKPF